ncbi:ATP-binding protein [Streptomyces sp. MMS21 TC-5]|uniref:ATP-binding protein n=1 Tax=Streptomyces sp. MMS21 TC-5 TaxID=2925833 RepID=UPI001F60D2DF|nr:ATP-binding protein [Streptomyces sp. MMS21 TC-5]MCI4078866.1 ATP-binding protein [Streptomyces sp. MMS21 TC-5]
MKRPRIDSGELQGLGEGPDLLRPPAPEWCNTLTNWRASVDRVLDPPDLADCAPLGTEIGPDDPRFVFHGSMRPVRTPAVAAAMLVVQRQLYANAKRTSGRIGVIIQGPSSTGKTTLMQYVGRDLEARLNNRYGRNDDRIPVVALSVPDKGRGGSRNWAGAFARFLGLEGALGSDPTESICYVMRSCHTQLVLIDGIQRLQPGADVEQSFSFLEHISDETGVTFVYCGRNSRAIVDPQLRDRETRPEKNEDPWGDHPVLMTSRLGYDQIGKDRFRRIVNEFDKDLRLYSHEPGALTALSPVLHLRSKGYLRALSQLICQAAQHAMLSGEECITEELLEGLMVGRVINI